MSTLSDGQPAADIQSPTAAALRTAFARSDSPDQLAEQAGATPSSRFSGGSTRCIWFQDDEVLTLVVGGQERSHVDTALGVGLAARGKRALRLILPEGWHEPTLHRWAWLRDDLPLRVWAHDGQQAVDQVRPSRQATMADVAAAEDPMLHLGDRTSWVEELMRWAGEQPQLDASHRPDVRAWQCRGQRVLKITRTKSGLKIVAGIDWGPNSPNPTPEPAHITGPLEPAKLASLKNLVLRGCKERLSGVAHKADEHWLQAVLRRHPRVLGLEQPVLRELAAWRPSGILGTRESKPRGRGFVDLAGLDATGTVLHVETKLDGDDMLVLQGLDYLIWAEANRERLTARLDCRKTVPFEISYCVGGRKGPTPIWSAHTKAQLDALAPDLRWHVQEVTHWTDDGPKARRGPLRTYPLPPAP